MSTLCCMLQADAELMAREIWVAKEQYEETKKIRVPLADYIYTHLSRQACLSKVFLVGHVCGRFVQAILLFLQGMCIC